MKDKQYKQHAEWLLSSQEFNLQLEAQDKFLNELADKYALKRELMHIGGRSNGSQSSLYLFYDKSPIGVITKEAREDSGRYFMDTTFTPNANANIICAEVDAAKEMEESSPKHSGNRFVI